MDRLTEAGQKKRHVYLFIFKYLQSNSWIELSNCIYGGSENEKLIINDGEPKVAQS